MQKIQAALALFNQDFPRPGMAPLELSKPYVVAADWPKEWPGAGLPGVYAFMDADNSVVYIGKASCGRTIGHRLAAYFQYGPNRIGVIATDSKSEAVTHVITVTVPANRAFEAAALEEFLIREVRPPRNKNGVWRHDIPMPPT
jgi:hypothetical protein